MAAVAAEDLVFGAQGERLPDGRRLLPDREVGGTGVDIGHVEVRALPLDRIEHQFELAYQQHVSTNAVQGLVAVQRAFLLEVWPVGVLTGIEPSSSSVAARTTAGSMRSSCHGVSGSQAELGAVTAPRLHRLSR